MWQQFKQRALSASTGRAIRAAAVLVLLEQGCEVLFLGVSLAEHPVLPAAALGALGAPLPEARE